MRLRCLHLDHYLFEVLEEQDGGHGEREELVGECGSLLSCDLPVERKAEGAVEPSRPQLDPDRVSLRDCGGESHRWNASHISSIKRTPQRSNTFVGVFAPESETDGLGVGLGGLGDLQDRFEAETFVTDARPL